MRLPNVLLILLDQNKSTGLWGKVDRHVYCPAVLDFADCEYALYAKITHLDYGGSTFSGHYVCYIRESDGSWWLCDDERVEEVSATEAGQYTPLFVLYQMMEPDMELPPDMRAGDYVSVDEEELFGTPRSNQSVPGSAKRDAFWKEAQINRSPDPECTFVPRNARNSHGPDERDKACVDEYDVVKSKFGYGSGDLTPLTNDDMLSSGDSQGSSPSAEFNTDIPTACRVAYK